MSDTFDPYHRWLSIPPEEQPPHHYRLLGLKELEDDADVIESAADRQMTHVRTFQSGKFAELSQRVLNEISAAKITLLEPTKKAAYDAALQAKQLEEKRKRRADRPLAVAQPLSATPLAVAVSQPPSPVPPTVAPPSTELAVETAFVHPAPMVSAASRQKRTGPPLAMIAAIGAIVVVVGLLLGAVAFVARPWETPTLVVANNAGGEHENSSTKPPQNLQDDTSGGNSNDTTKPLKHDPPKVKPPKAKPPVPVPEDIEPTEPPDDFGVVELPHDFGEEELLDDEPLEPAPQRSPVPPKAERDAKRARIDAIFQTAKVKTPAEKAKLAAQIFQTARETPDDVVARFVMLNLTRELAADSARMQLAFDAIELLEQQFDFDAAAIRIVTIGQGAKANVPNETKQEVVALGVELADQLSLADRYADASKVLTSLVELARRARESQVAAALVERRRVNEAFFAAYKSAQGAFDTLEKSPDDPAANLAAGRFHLFVKNDPARGLTHLAKSGDDPLAAAAKAELAHPQTPDDQEILADAWWDLGAKETDKLLQRKLQSRALAWYERAEPNLTGLAAAKADKRIEELGAAGVTPADINLNLGVISRPPNVGEPATKSLDVTRGLVAHWKFDEGEGTVARDSVGEHHGTIKGATWVNGVRNKALSFSRRDAVVEIGKPATLNFAGPITFAAWAKLSRFPTAESEVTATMNIVSHNYNGRDLKEVYLRIQNRGSVMVAAGGYDRDHIEATHEVTENDLGEWTHWCSTFDGSNWTIFKNGRLVVKQASQVGGIEFDSPWCIGNDAWGNRGFIGDIDEVRIYNRGLSADEVRALYLGTSSSPVSAPRVDPPLDNTQGSLPTTKSPVHETTPPTPLASRLTLTRAVYGIGNEAIEVTEHVRRALAADPFAPLQADDRTFGDPAPGKQKEFALAYELAGRPQTAKLTQQQVFALPPLPASGLAVKDAAKEFRIVAARFGAGLTWFDITDTVREKATASDQVVDWSIHKVDPWFGVPKHYCIWFDYQGKRYVRVMIDGAKTPLLP